MKEIPLTQGKVALVDDEDYNELMKYKWCVVKIGNVYYASRKAWNKDKKQGRMSSMHRHIIKTPEGMETDHINGNGLDNRRCNLRVCTKQENRFNQFKKMGTSSNFKGVYYNTHTKKWKAHIKYNRVDYYLGEFKIEEDAARAYNKKAKELFGEFTKLNILDEQG